MLVMLVELEPHFRRSAQQQLLLETLLVRFALLDRTVDLESVLRGVMASPAGPPAFGGGGTSRAEPSRAEPLRAESSRAEPVRAAPAREAEPARPSASAVREGEASRSTPPRLRDSVAAAPSAEIAAPSPRPAPRAAAPVAADIAAPAATVTVDINRLAEHWDEIVDVIRRGGRGTLAGMLDHATPLAVAGNGTVTLAVDTEAHGDAITQAADHVLTALRTRFRGVERLAVKAQQAAPMERLTEENVLQRRVAQLRKRDPILDAAISALDLRMIP
jgi:DNA polymerase-3 subunit gamma/tau